MSKLLITNLLFICCLSFFGCQLSSNKGAPEPVKITFEKMYPGENDPDWVIDKNRNFEASFKKDGVHYRADFSPDGTWIETENSLKEKKLPEAIKKLLEDSYKKYKIVELEFVTHYKKGAFYDVELKKGSEKFDLMITKDGKIIGKEK